MHHTSPTEGKCCLWYELRYTQFCLRAFEYDINCSQGLVFHAAQTYNLSVLRSIESIHSTIFSIIYQLILNKPQILSPYLFPHKQYKKY